MKEKTQPTPLSTNLESLSINTPDDSKEIQDKTLGTSQSDESYKSTNEDSISNSKSDSVNKNTNDGENNQTIKYAQSRQEHLSQLKSWINQRMTIEMTDGRVLVGTFLCTDRDANIILGSCGEYLSPQLFENREENGVQEGRLLGLVMVPGQHIVNILYDQPHIS
ncbi:hypothetical protein WDU94_010527 [Cyamophila willieti]